MRYYSDDPVRDAERYFCDQDKLLEKLPVCYDCDNPIQDENCYEFDGMFFCPECMENNHKRNTYKINW